MILGRLFVKSRKFDDKPSGKKYKKIIFLKKLYADSNAKNRLKFQSIYFELLVNKW